MPKFKKIEKGEIQALNSNDLMALKWCDKRDIHMLSNLHSEKTVITDKVDYKTGDFKLKPECVVDYTKNMGAVDKVDRILGFGEATRKSFKWYKKIFFRILDIATINSHFLKKMKSKNDISFGDFRQNLIRQMIQKYHKERPSTSGGRRPYDSPLRLDRTHFQIPVPQTEAGKGKTRRRCHVCKNTTLRPQKRQETKYMCEECGIAMCVYPCFKDYHTKINY
jgi:hypothetical protein